MSGGYRCCEHGIFLTEELPGPDAPVDQIEAKFTFEPLGWAGDGYGGRSVKTHEKWKKNIKILISTRLKAQENHQWFLKFHEITIVPCELPKFGCFFLSKCRIFGQIPMGKTLPGLRYYEPDAPEVLTAKGTMQPSCCDATGGYLSNSSCPEWKGWKGWEIGWNWYIMVGYNVNLI